MGNCNSEKKIFSRSTKDKKNNDADNDIILFGIPGPGKNTKLKYNKIEIAENLLSQNIDINTISVATGLPVEKINVILNHIKRKIK